MSNNLKMVQDRTYKNRQDIFNNP